MAERGRIRVERGAKRVRVMLGGVYVVDTLRPLLVWEKPYYPTYYFPVEDVRTDLLTESGETRRSPSRGTAVLSTVKVGTTEAHDGAWSYPDSPIEELRDHIAFDWNAMDRWFEEDEQVFVHPRDPYSRVDTLRSSRHIEVSVNGVKVGDSTSAVILFETGLPARYYLPQTDVRMDLLVPTDTRTECPYKGVAEYWSVQAGEELVSDIVWSYPFPLPESIKVAGLLAFYNEKVDITIDGVPQERPKTIFS